MFNPKGIVRESGNIKKCFDEFYEDFVISDELRKVRNIILIHHVQPSQNVPAAGDFAAYNEIYAGYSLKLSK